MKDFQMRPYRIAAEIDSMFSGKKLSGIGRLEFVGASYLNVSDEFGGVCLMYLAIHGEEDKINPLNPASEESIIENFDAIFNER